jgi:hypothetical protein
MAVAMALAADAATKDHQTSILVNCYLGMITLTAPGLPADVGARAKEIAASVPGVREVFTQF